MATAVESKLRDLLELAQVVLDDLPVGLLVLSSHGKPLWFNREAEVVCAVWNKTPLRKDALPLKRADFTVPAALWQECEALLAADTGDSGTPEPRLLSEADRGLHAVIRLQHRPVARDRPRVSCSSITGARAVIATGRFPPAHSACCRGSRFGSAKWRCAFATA